MGVLDVITDPFKGEDVDAYKPDWEQWNNYGVDDYTSGYFLNELSRNQKLQDAAAAGQGRAAQGANDYRNVEGIWNGQAAQGFRDANQRLGMQDNSRYGQEMTAAALRENQGYQQQSAYQKLMQMGDQGPGPSAAQAQLQSGQDAAMQQSLALARSGRGGGANAAALRNAQFQNAQLSQQTNQQSAILRAQEEANWRAQRGQLYGSAGSLATNQRGQDIGALQAAGALSSQQRAQDIGAAQAQGQMAQAQGQMALGYGGLTAGAENAQQNWWKGQAAEEAQRQALMQNQQQGRQGYEKLYSQNAMGAQGINTQQDLQRDQQTMGLAMAAGGALAMMSDRDAKYDIKPVDLEMGPWDKSYDQYQVEAQAAKGQGSNPFGQFMMNYGGQMMAASDERSKTKIQSLQAKLDALSGQATVPSMEEDAARTVGNAQGYSYKYKQPDRFGQGTFYGPMAQDLEKTPVGRSVVRQSPDGTKMVDTSRLSLVNTAALNANQKQDAQQDAKLDALMAELDKLRNGGGAVYPTPRSPY